MECKQYNINEMSVEKEKEYKNFDRSKSEKLLEIKNNIVKKYKHVPVVKTSLYLHENENNLKSNVYNRYKKFYFH